MSNSIIPHLLNDEPPPLIENEEEIDDEFGDFTGNNDVSFDDDLLPVTPKHSVWPEKRENSDLEVRNDLLNILDQIENNIPKVELCLSEENQIKCNFKGEVEAEFLDRENDENSLENIVENSSVLEHNKFETQSINLEEIHVNSTENNSDALEEFTEFSAVNTEIDQFDFEEELSGLENDVAEVENSKFEKIQVITTEDNIDKLLGNDLKTDENHEAFTEFSAVNTEMNNFEIKEKFAEPENEVTEVEDSKFEEDDDGFSEFTAYSCSEINKNDKITEDFAKFESISGSEHQIDDDFGDFSSCSNNNFDLTENDSIKLQFKTPLEALEHAELVFNQIFPKDSENDGKIDDFRVTEIPNSDHVFENLKDLTETNALKYQWGNSTTQKNLLKNLNIDVRNLLYGPTWKSGGAGVPIFAVNLCSTPLEPMKSESTAPKPLEVQHQEIQREPPIPTASPPTSEPVRAVEFDWNTSGLVNPLECSDCQNMLLDLTEILNDSSNVSTGLELDSPCEFDDLDHFCCSLEEVASKKQPEETQFMNKDNISMNSLNLTENHQAPCDVSNDDFGDFTSSQPCNPNDQMFQLRESHISTNEPQNSQNVLTFDVDFLEKFETERPKVDSKLSSKPQIDFQEFEMFKEEITTVKPSTNSETVLPHSTLNIQNKQFSNSNTDNSVVDVNNGCANDEFEDEFTDFHSSRPETVKVAAILEPLRPEPIRNHQISSQRIAKIDWPEPGLDEDEINRIIQGCSRKIEVKNEVKTRSKEGVKESIEDEWSDFVSVKEPQPVKSRTNTPDLTLSVLNLSNLRPVKQPTPMVLPNGTTVHSPVKNSTRIGGGSTTGTGGSLLIDDDEWGDFVSASNSNGRIFTNPTNSLIFGGNLSGGSVPELSFVSSNKRNAK